ncbi:MAG: AAA family ATPase [Candidatus Aegiribacteria sp.]|nr:AAA family ATPase [Candidatus Aegiribacteria sp.]
MDKNGIYIAGSDMNAGKTTLSLGLISWLVKHFEGGASFMKPLGQKTTVVDGEPVGEDTFLVNTSLGLNIPLEYTAPFTMSSGISEKFLAEGHPSDMKKKILKAYRHLRSISDVVVVEGTGHPGVGSVFNLCNASVASLMNIPVLLVLNAGIGRTIDRFTLCSSLFHDRDIPLLGVIINKVHESKMEKVRKYLDPWFSERGIPVFGYIPYVKSFANPSLGMLSRELGVETLISWKKNRDVPVEGFIAGFGSSGEIISEISDTPESALLLSSKRREVIDAILARRLSGSLEKGPGAIVLCGKPSENESYMSNACDKLDIPLYRSLKSAGDSVSILNRRIFKIEPGESVKISEILRTVKENVDIERMIRCLQTSGRTQKETTGKPMDRLRSWLTKIFYRQ